MYSWKKQCGKRTIAQLTPGEVLGPIISRVCVGPCSPAPQSHAHVHFVPSWREPRRQILNWLATPFRRRARHIVSQAFAGAPLRHPQPALTRILRELSTKFGNVFMRGRPVRVACITVEHQRAGFQRFFESFLTECNGLVLVVRTHDFKIHAVAHEPPADLAILDQACQFLIVARACASGCGVFSTLSMTTAQLAAR